MLTGVTTWPYAQTWTVDNLRRRWEVTARPRAALAMGAGLAERLLAPADLRELATLVDLHPAVITDGWAGHDLTGVRFLVTCWGAPRIDSAALAHLPDLTHVFHAAGSVKAIADPLLWQRGIQVTTAAAANAIPVAEYTLAHILLAGKAVRAAEATYRASCATAFSRPAAYGGEVFESAGNYRKVIGIISASSIGRLVLDRLRTFDLEVLLYDPFVDAGEAAGLGARKVTLDELFASSDIVSLHAPDLPATRGLVSRKLLRLLRPGATFINTARPAIVDQDALVEVLLDGTRFAVLDVTDPEPLPREHPLWGLPNVTLTPHWAGSQGLELHRMGRMAIDSLKDVLEGRCPRGLVHRSALATMA